MSKQELVIYVQVEGGSQENLETRRLPVMCDLCNKPNLEEFIDGQCGHGGWANMCLDCYRERGIKLGIGFGQRYKLRDEPIPGLEC